MIKLYLCQVWDVVWKINQYNSPHWPIQRIYCVMSSVDAKQHLMSNNLASIYNILKYQWCVLLLELPHWRNDEILKMKFQGGEWDDLGKVRNFYRGCPWNPRCQWARPVCTVRESVHASLFPTVQIPLCTLEETRTSFYQGNLLSTPEVAWIVYLLWF